MLANTLRSPAPGAAPLAKGKGAASAPGMRGVLDIAGLAVVAEAGGIAAKAAPVGGRPCEPPYAASLSPSEPDLEPAP